MLKLQTLLQGFRVKKFCQIAKILLFEISFEIVDKI